MTRPSIARAALATLLALLAVAGTASAAAPVPEREPWALGDGAWSWFADPRAVHHAGRHRRTYVGWIARDGDVMVSSYDHDTRRRTTAVLHEELQVDDHGNPALLVRPDGRLTVFYSAHAGPAMYSRISTRPEDVSGWEPERTVPTNTPGSRGYTYPNPIRLPAERRTFLFWRGGDYQPTFSVQGDGSDQWSPARDLIAVPGGRPYAKFASNGSDAIHVAFTNAHPREIDDNNIYYAAYRGGQTFRADGTRIGELGAPVTPAQADLVFDAPANAWVHDIALDADGRPVIVFASFPSPTDHRYHYARWTGERWEVREITPAGGSISADGREQQYSGGITLDHEDPATVYLSRDVAGMFEVERWTTADGGASWSREPITTGSSVKNVRPISPRGLIPFSGDMGVLWMRGVYQSYVDYQTSIATVLATGGNQPPIADAEHTPRTGAAPLTVAFDASASRDPDGSIAGWSWDFGDGSPPATGARTSHVYQSPGRYFARLTVTDDRGLDDTLVKEVVIDAAGSRGRR